MKAKKLLCIFCTFSILLALTACNGDPTYTPKGDESSIGKTNNSEAVMQLNGKDCHFNGDDARLSQYPEPYCSLKKDKMIKPGIQTTVSSDLDKRPYYKIWLKNDRETDCAYTDAKIFKFFMLGGEPGDMVYHGVTFGQTKEEVDEIADANPRISFGSNEYEETLRSLLFKELGENWADQITEEYYVYDNRGPDGLGYKLYVAFLDGKVYAMGVSAYYQ